uniref:Uncharacterized protein n=1 Tax=Arundo donax TaxID=35708 RepID=A0A0A9BL34_ARUDO
MLCHKNAFCKQPKCMTKTLQFNL